MPGADIRGLMYHSWPGNTLGGSPPSGRQIQPGRWTDWSHTLPHISPKKALALGKRHTKSLKRL